MDVTEREIAPDRSLGDLVGDHPEFARVFESLGVDFCCGGDQTLRAACKEERLDVDEVRRRLLDARRDGTDERDDWESMSELIDDVVTTHHQYLRGELPALGELVGKVRRVHGDNHPELAAVEREFRELADEVRRHIDEEEDDVFPIIEKLERGAELADDERAVIDEALEDLEADHEATAAHLERIAELTDEYEVPDDACPSYRSMLERLEALERDTHMHVHKENNLLFPTVESRLAEG